MADQEQAKSESGKGDGPGTIGLTGSNQPDLVAPSGQSHRIGTSDPDKNRQ